MNNIDINISEILSRIRYLYLNNDVYVTCLDSYKGFKVLDLEVGPFEKGSKYKVKQFIADSLIHYNIFEKLPGEKLDNLDVQRHAISERDNQKLEKKNNPLFLMNIRENKRDMLNDVENKKKTKMDFDRYNSYMSNIIYNRLLKSLRLSTTEISTAEENRLTTSEKKLFSILNKIILEWLNFFLHQEQL